ncbi:hypothetical protein [Vibrio tasmaniensis]|nr:hypothetical protein [Vibrio tasmaniensis]
MQSKRDEMNKTEFYSNRNCERCGERILKKEERSNDGYCGDCRNRVTGE